MNVQQLATFAIAQSCEQFVHPELDDKPLTSRNTLAIGALAELLTRRSACAGLL